MSGVRGKVNKREIESTEAGQYQHTHTQSADVIKNPESLANTEKKEKQKKKTGKNKTKKQSLTLHLSLGAISATAISVSAMQSPSTLLSFPLDTSAWEGRVSVCTQARVCQR